MGDCDIKCAKDFYITGSGSEEEIMPYYDSLGLPKDVGATDFLDSARLAGMLSIVDPNNTIDLSLYTNGVTYVRHPNVNPNDPKMSRDQIVPLFAGMFFKNQSIMVDPNYNPPNGDWISPSVRGHFKRCAGLQSKWYEDLWLVFDIIWSAKVDPMAEPNQLIAMMFVAGENYLKLWTHMNTKWFISILNYWCSGDGSWRQEPELANRLFVKIESLVSEDT